MCHYKPSSVSNIVISCLAFLLLNLTAFSQTDYLPRQISHDSRKIVNKLKRYNMVTGERIGRTAVKSDQYEIFEQLGQMATENELFELTNHRSPTVRAYSFLGLIKMKSSRLLEVIQKNEFDSTEIKTQFGCIGGSNTVIGYMVVQLKIYLEENKIEMSLADREIYNRVYRSYSDYRERERNEKAIKAVKN